mgnify:CR=1 FL=1
MFRPTTVAARRILKRAAIQSGLEAVSLVSKAGLMPEARGLGAIFTLHHVRPAIRKEFDPAAHLTITPEFLDASITRLKACGYVPVSLEDLPEYLARQDRPGPVLTCEIFRQVFERNRNITAGFEPGDAGVEKLRCDRQMGCGVKLFADGGADMMQGKDRAQAARFRHQASLGDQRHRFQAALNGSALENSTSGDGSWSEHVPHPMDATSAMQANFLPLPA